MRIFINFGGSIKTVDLDPYLTVQELKKKFGLYPQENFRWSFNGKILENSKPLKYYNIFEDCTIHITTRLKGGGFGINVVDISKNKTKIIDFNDNAPFYRRVFDGLNVHAECSNFKCKAYKDGIYCPIGFVWDYDIFKNLRNIKCPVCNEEVYPKNFGFLNCKYTIEYTAYKDGSKSEGKIDGEAGEKFKIFDEESGTANFTKLIFTITRN